MTNACLTRLDAVNSLLLAVGEMPIATLDDALPSDAVLALRCLNDATVNVLLEGFYFNTDENVELAPNAYGEILLPEDVISVDTDPRVSSAEVDVVMRENKLYDKKNNTFIFEKPVVVTLVRGYDFDDIPATIRQYIIGFAKASFVAAVLGDTALVQNLTAEAQRLRAICVADDIRQADKNILSTRGNSRIGYSSVHRILRR